MKNKEFKIEFIEDPKEFSNEELSRIIGGASSDDFCGCFCIILIGNKSTTCPTNKPAPTCPANTTH